MEVEGQQEAGAYGGTSKGRHSSIIQQQNAHSPSAERMPEDRQSVKAPTAGGLSVQASTAGGLSVPVLELDITFPSLHKQTRPPFPISEAPSSAHPTGWSLYRSSSLTPGGREELSSTIAS